MANDKKLIAMELQQIILADRIAADAIHGAEDTARSIGAHTEKKKAAILEEAARRKEAVTQAVQQEQAQALAARKQETQKQFARQRQSLEKTMEQNRERWISEITGRITGQA